MSEKPALWEGFSFWPSFADVMVVTLLMFVFFLFAQMTLNTDALALAELVRRQTEIRDEVMTVLDEERAMVSIVPDGNLQRILFSDRILFARGEADLLPKGREILSKVGGVLKAKSALFRTAQVEGHTDRSPIRTVKFPSNWELSSARATSVVRFLQDQIGLNPEILSANGYAEFRPVDSHQNDDAYTKNRRVELVLVYSSADLLK